MSCKHLKIQDLLACVTLYQFYCALTKMFQRSPFHSEGMLQSVSWQHCSGSCCCGTDLVTFTHHLVFLFLVFCCYNCTEFKAWVFWFPRIMYSMNPSLEITRIGNSEEIIEENKFKKPNYVSYLYSQVWCSLIFITVKISSLTSEISLLKNKLNSHHICCCCFQLSKTTCGKTFKELGI